MPSDVGRGCQIISSDASLIQKYATQNVPSGAMAEQSTSVAAHSTGRMILVAFLVLGYCLTSCFGVPHRPAAFSRRLDSAGSLERIQQISNNAIAYHRFAPSDMLYQGENTRADSGLDDKGNKLGRTNKSRKSSLMKLLDDLTKLQHRRIHGSPEIDTETDSNVEENTKEIASKLGVNTIHQQTYYHLQPGLPRKQQSETPLYLKPLQVVAQLDMVLSPSPDDPAKTASADKTPQKHKQFITNHFLSILDGSVTNGNEINGVSEVYKYFTDGAAVNSDQQEQKIENMEMGGTQFHSEAESLDKDKYYMGYLIVPSDFESSDYNSDTFDRKHIQYGGRQEDDDTSSYRETNFMDIPREAVAIATGIDSVVRDIHSSDPSGDGTNQLSKTLSLESLIHKTVKKMEGIIKKRVAHYNGIYEAESGHNLREGISQTHTGMGAQFGLRNSDSGHVVTSSGESDSSSSDVNTDDVADNEEQEDSHKLFPQLQDHREDDVISAVSKAVASRTVPRDAQFWRNVSSYLDSSDYLSRTRRSPLRSRKRAQFVHLSITYGHVMPCEYKDRFYCMNGGTCVFVGALDIKTCRCPIGYTGVRCEMIDQEYILSLLTNTLIFS